MRHLIVLCSLVAIQTISAQEITIALSDVGSFVVTDPMGRRIGSDPRGGSTTTFDEIPDAYYGTEGSDSENPNYPGITSTVVGVYGPAEGNYRVDVIGVAGRVFDLSIFLNRLPLRGASFDFKGIVGPGESVRFSFNYHNDPGSSLHAVKAVDRASLRQDLDNCYKLSLLGEKQLYDDLSHRVDKFEKYLEKEDSVKASHELQKFGKKLDEVYGKDRKKALKDEESKRREYQEEEKGKERGKEMDESEGKRKKHFITDDAYTILKEDISLLLEQLPEKEKGKKPKGGKERD